MALHLGNQKGCYATNPLWACETMLVCVFVYVHVYVYTAGMAVAGGTFLNSMLAGAGFGRCFGQVVHTLLHNHHVVDTGLYAFLGKLPVEVHLQPECVGCQWATRSNALCRAASMGLLALQAHLNAPQ